MVVKRLSGRSHIHTIIKYLAGNRNDKRGIKYMMAGDRTCYLGYCIHRAVTVHVELTVHI